MIQLQNLSFSYAKGKTVFKNFNLSFDKGNIYGLLGMNGTGKSTMLYLMSGLLKAKSGSVTVDNLDMSKRPVKALSEIFLLPEEFELPAISLSNYLKINSPFYPRFSDDLFKSCLENFGLSLDLDLGSLSMGQKKKVYISFALATNVSYLIMDEPTNGLDIPSKSQFRKVIAMSMNDERSIIVSTHQVNDMEQMFDHVVIIYNSDIVLNASISEIGSKLRFADFESSEQIDNPLYVQPYFGGNHVILPNSDHYAESNVNIETLFNGVLSNPTVFSSMFNNK